MILRDATSITPEGVSHNPEILKRVFLRSGQVPPVLQFATVDFQPGQRAAEHEHTGMVEIFYVTQGSGTVMVDGREHVLRPGMTLVVEPGEAHELVGSDEGMQVAVVAIEL